MRAVGATPTRVAVAKACLAADSVAARIAAATARYCRVVGSAPTVGQLGTECALCLAVRGKLHSHVAVRAQRRPGAVDAVELRDEVVAGIVYFDRIPCPDPERVEAPLDDAAGLDVPLALKVVRVRGDRAIG